VRDHSSEADRIYIGKAEIVDKVPNYFVGGGDVIIFARNVPDKAVMFFWDKDCVAFAELRAIKEGVKMLVLIDFVRGDLSFYDFAKCAVVLIFHVGIVLGLVGFCLWGH